MQGVPNTMVLETIGGYPLPETVEGLPITPTPKQGSNFYDSESYPLPITAKGPNFETGASYYPVWTPSGLSDGYFAVIAPNYGINGSKAGSAQKGSLTNPQEAGLTEFATNKVRSLKWDPEALPGFDPRLPAWNVLPPGSYYRGHVPSVKSNRTYAGSAGKQNIAGPLNFSTPGVAQLVQTGLSGS